MPDQETYGRFTPAAWNLVKSIKLTVEEHELLRLMIEEKRETITQEEIRTMLYTVVHQKV